MLAPPTKVFRKQLIEGYSIPAFLRNGSYFFADIDVYADGRVSCWHMEDFEHFKKDVARGWVSTSIPDGNRISIHGLGDWEIKAGSWLFDQISFIHYVQDLVRDLNPELDNVYTYRQKAVNGVQIGEIGRGTDYKEVARYQNDPFPEKIDGEGVNLFCKRDSCYFLVKVIVFPDSTIRITRLETPLTLTLDEFNGLVKEQVIVTDIPLNSAVTIYGLGDFTAVQASYVTSVEDKVLELYDILSTLNGKLSSLDIGRQEYDNYLKNPTLENKEKLKISYENIPEHLRMFIGDMDTKDVEVLMIIYGEQEIENWSHYQVAKAQGLELPTIQLPKASGDAENDDVSATT